MISRYELCLVSLYLLFHIGLYAQNPPPMYQGLQIATDVYHGELLEHRAEMDFGQLNPVSAVSIEVMKQTLGREYWHYFHGYPRYGFMVMMQDFGNAELLGKSYGFGVQLEHELFSYRRLALWSKLGYGICYINRPYHRLTNPENIAIGSYINNMTTVGLMLEYKVAKHIRLRTGGRFTHTSNGKLRIPNLGINTAKVFAGIGYEMAAPEDFEAFEYEKHPINKRNQLNIRFGYAVKEYKVDGGPSYPVYISSIFGSRMLSRKNKLIGGLEFALDKAEWSFMQDADIEWNTEGLRPWYATAYIGHEFMFGQFGFMTHCFMYLNQTFRDNNFMGFKLGPNFYFKRPYKNPRYNVFTGIYLKAHYANASYAEVVLGINL